MTPKPNLLLLHGALGSAASFSRFLPALETDFSVATLDFEGHGDSADAGREFRIQHFTENVLHLLDERGVERIDVFGYSMGGYVALYLASIAPERVRTVATLATKFNWTPDTAAREATMLDPDAMAEKVPAFVAQLEAVHSGSGWRNVVDRTRGLLLSLGEDPVVTDACLSAVQCPTLVMVGDRDAMVGFEESRKAFQLLPNGRFAVLPATKHPLEKVHSEILLWHLRHFIYHSE